MIGLVASDFTVIIPARFASSRLYGKPLMDIAGKPMVQHVYERACQSQAKKIIIATDDKRIVDAVQKFDAEVCLTHQNHASGTDRLQEVVQYYNLPADEVLVNVQGDEPLIPPSIINQVANNLVTTQDASAATLCEPINNIKDLLNPNIVKVVVNQNGMALYFSRAPIPWAREHFTQTLDDLPPQIIFHRHIGIYAYRAALLNQFVQWEPAPIESIEMLEQLRLMWYGCCIHVADAQENVPHGIDTKEDLQAICHLLSAQV